MKFNPVIVVLVIELFCVSGCSDTGLGLGGGAYQATSIVVLPPDLGIAGDSNGDAGSDVADITASAGSGPGNFRGRVVLTETVPALPAIHGKGADVKDAEYCSAEPLPNEKLVVGSDSGVANVFIYLQKPPRGTPKPEVTDVPVDFDQKNCRFVPHCLVVPVGQTIRILSGDGIAHNTHTYPKRGAQTNQGVTPNDRDGVLRFAYQRAENEPLVVKCDLHTWMTAWHLPVDHPYVALTDADGNFEIQNLPSGDHMFTVWHEAAKGKKIHRRLKVTIVPGETTTEVIKYPVSELEL